MKTKWLSIMMIVILTASLWSGMPVQPASAAIPTSRVQSATGNTSANQVTSFTVNLGSAPTIGNSLVAAISTRGTVANQVASITQTGASWSRVVQATNANGTTTEIWYASNVSSAGTSITVNLANSLRAAAVVAEYTGALAADVSANASGSGTAASTGTTATTNVADELWFGGIGLVSSGYTLGTPTNSFTAFANAASTNTTATLNARVYALERIVTATGTANSGGTVSTSSQWSGAIATFVRIASSATGTYTLSFINGDTAVYRFTGSGTFTASQAMTVDYLVVAGGGGGGGQYGSSVGGTAGGGAGGMLTGSLALSTGSNTVTVGAGGTGAACVTNSCSPGTNGGNSVFASITTIGGGYGGYTVSNSGNAGGSGGGARMDGTAGSGTAGPPRQGYNGGTGNITNYGAGGGGGAGAVGGSTTTATGAAGGTGSSSSITGTSVTYAGGGGGGTYGVGTGGTGGTGGGGAGGANCAAGSNATANTGGGGGGAGGGSSCSAASGGNGGSGIVIVRYLLPDNRTYAGTATATTASNTSINVSMPYTYDSNGNNTYTVEYRPACGSWKAWISGAAHTQSPYQTTITGLAPGVSYDVRVTYIDPDGGVGTNPQTISAVTTSELTFTSDTNWQVPAGVYQITVELWGGGGAGGGVTSFGAEGAGGAGGQYAIKVVNVTPGQTYSIDIAASQPGTTGNGSAGYDSTFATNVVVAKGGAGGQANNRSAGLGSTDSGVGDTVYAGGDGGEDTSSTSGAGGGGAGSTGSGKDASGTTAGGATLDYGGAGGAGLTTVGNGAAGSNYGGAGSGGRSTDGTDRNGGSGAQGFARISWKPVASVTLSNLTQTYTGSPLTPTATSFPSGLNIVWTNAPQTNAGSYAVTATINDSCYQGQASNTFVIQKATPIATLSVTNSPVCYDGSPHAATVSISTSSVPGSLSNILTGSAASQTAANTYAVTANFVPTDSTNYNTLTSLSAGNFVIRNGLTFNSTTTGNWSVPGTWDQGSVPLTCDFVVVPDTKTLTLDSNQTVAGSVTVNSGGTLVLGTNTLSGSGAFTLSSGGTLEIGSTDGISSSGASGNIQMTGTPSFSTGANYVYNGVSAQVTGSGLPSTVNNLTINNAAGVSLSQGVTVNGALTLTNGLLTLGGYNLTLIPNTAVAGGPFSASKMIVADGAGALCKQYTSTISYTYPIGDVTGTAEYSPATLSFTSLGNPSNYQVCVRVTDAVHPNNYEPNYLTRYWTVTTSGSADSLSCDVNFTYVDADFGTLTEANLVGAKWDDSTWTLLGAVNDGSNAVVGTVTSFSDFTAGYGPTAVTVAPPQASGQGQAIVVSWQAASEVGIVRYRLYRSIGLDGERSLVYETPANTGQMEEASYEYYDTAVEAGVVYTYWLEVESLGGEMVWLPPTSAMLGGYRIYLPAVHR